LAALAYVGRSVAHPGLYYRTNVAGSLNLLEAMQAAGVGRLVFSSTCATYGAPDAVPIGEDCPQRPINPYGRSKLVVEQMLEDFGQAHGLRSVALRYFNACGADPGGLIGERHEPESHLIPLAIRAARPGGDFALTVFGDDFATPDGTCVRDYVHVSDLAAAHVAAAEYLAAGCGSAAFNLGTGAGHSVREVIAAVARGGRVIRRRWWPTRRGRRWFWAGRRGARISRLSWGMRWPGTRPRLCGVRRERGWPRLVTSVGAWGLRHRAGASSADGRLGCRDWISASTR
jgi:UDP-glucose-4-epimerase GalE